MEVTQTNDQWLTQLFFKASEGETIPIPYLVLRAKERLGSIEALLSWLNEFNGRLENDLRKLIQTNYHSFLELHEKNHQLQLLTQEIRPQVLGIKQHTQTVLQALIVEQKEIEDRIKKSHELETKKNTLKLFIRLHDLVEKLSKLLARPFTDADALSVRCSHVERVANEFNQLKYYASEGAKFPFVISLAPRISSLERALTQQLAQLMQIGFVQKERNVISTCLHSYVTIGAPALAEEIFQRRIVEPAVDRLLTPFVEKPSLDIHQFYAAILDFVASDCGYLLKDSPSTALSMSGEFPQSPLSQVSPTVSTTTASSTTPSDVLSPRPILSASGEIVNSPSVSVRKQSKGTARALDRLQALAQHQVEGERRALNISKHFHFLANAIFPVLDTQIGKRMAKVFTCGVPDYFASNYLASVKFLDDLELYFGDNLDNLQKFRQSQAYNSFLSRWNVSFYFSFRFQEVTNRVDESVNKPVDVQESAVLKAIHEKNFILPFGLECWNSLQLCWNEFYLFPLSHRFFKLTLQIIKRFHAGTKEAIGKKFAPLKESDGIYYYHDIKLFREKLSAGTATLYSKDSTKVAPLSPVLKSEIKSQIMNLSNQLVVLLEEISQSLIRVLTDKCAKELSGIHSIPRAYRLVTGAVVEHPMQYVENLLKPLMDFHEKYKFVLHKPTWKEWLVTIVDALLKKYSEMVKTLLTTERQREDLLLKVKKTQKSPTNATQPNELTDTDKMELQLQLDFKKFAELLCSFSGMKITSFEAYFELTADRKSVV